MNWLFFALLTVASWGLYGVLLHTGQLAMADPVNGRIKAFLFVGLAEEVDTLGVGVAGSGAHRSLPSIFAVRSSRRAERSRTTASSATESRS